MRWQDGWGQLPLPHAPFHRFLEGVDLLSPVSPAGVRDSGGRLPEEQEPGQPLRGALEPENGVGEDPPGGGAAEAEAAGRRVEGGGGRGGGGGGRDGGW